MNESCMLQETTVEPARPGMAVETHISDTSAAKRPEESGRLSSAELAQKVLKLTGSVRLASRSSHHWHHCGINE